MIFVAQILKNLRIFQVQTAKVELPLLKRSASGYIYVRQKLSAVDQEDNLDPDEAEDLLALLDSDSEDEDADWVDNLQSQSITSLLCLILQTSVDQFTVLYFILLYCTWNTC